ncbi:response regulator [Arenimonas sp.]|uniref:Hpt domain-containing response regulator n=1 Tax=Arenimonas sp. TaxID=1872635 RepID=UPI0039E359EF
MTEALPRLLLVEDDAVSRQFLAEALRGLPAEVDAAGTIAQACGFASRHAHALWLVDAHLPDGDGIAALTRLRELDEATPAVAITAERWQREFDRLEAAGFVEILQKPIALPDLQANVRRLIGLGPGKVADAAVPRCGKRPVWDAEQALAAMAGNRAAWLVLGRLFLDELPQQREQLRQAHELGDAAAMHGLLHRLTASSGFVGASRISAAVLALARSPLDPRLWRDFEHAVEDTLATALPQS